MMVATVTWVRLTWTAAAALGTIVTLVLLSMAITDYKLLGIRNLNGWRRYVARTSIFIFLGGFGTQAIYLAAGVIALMFGPSQEHTEPYQQVIGALFIFGALSSIALAIMIFYRRQKILWVIEEALYSDKRDRRVGDDKESDDQDSYKDTSLNEPPHEGG